jgi:hypothetical protein
VALNPEIAMNDLPEHLGRALHAICGHVSEEDEKPVVATLPEIRALMGDPPAVKTLNGWLVDLEERGMVEQDLSGWRVTKQGWRTVNRLPTNDD